MHSLSQLYDALTDRIMAALRLHLPPSVNYPPGKVEELTLYLVLILIDLYLVWFVGRALYRRFFPPSAEAPRGRLYWLKAACTGLVVALVPLLLLEGSVRLFVSRQQMPTYLPHPLYLWRFAPSAPTRVDTPIEPMIFKTNSMGLRDYEIPLRKEPGEFRVICLGDSATFGQSVDLDKCYSKVLQKLLTERYPGRKFTVINAGIPGYSILQGYHFFEEVGLRYQPDLVVVNEFNEFSDRQMGEFATHVPADPMRRELKRALWSSMLYMTLRKEMMRFLRPDVAKVGDMSDSQDPILNVAETSQYIESFIKLLRKKHIRGVFVLWRRPASWTPLYARLLKDVKPEEGIVYEDYHFRVLSKPGFWLPNDPTHHPSEKGHDLMARALLETIDAHHLVPSNP